MSNEVQKYHDAGIDGFDAPLDGGGIIKGTRLKFGDKTALWYANGAQTPPDLTLTVIDWLRVLTFWGPDKKPIWDKTRVLDPGERVDIKALNEAEHDKGTWFPGFDGRLRGPYELQNVLQFIDPRDMSEYTFATATAGGEVADRELAKRIKTRRKFNARAGAVVRLSSCPWKTNYGVRPRPFYAHSHWIDLATGQVLADLTAGSQPQQIAPPPTPKPVDDLDDEIPF